MKDVSRNAPCPCGSGEKFKHCCMDATATATERRSLSPVLRWQLPLIAIVFGGLVLLIIMTQGQGSGVDGAGSESTSSPTTQPSTALPTTGIPPGGTPEPWFYDEANNQHWHPGHAHWHSGPPPPPDQRDAGSTAVPSTQPSGTQPAGIPSSSGQPDAYGRQPGDPHYGHNHP